MDSISQAVLGASVAEFGLGKKLGNKAVLWGAAIGTLPDLDIIPGKLFNEIDRLLFHRGPSHSFLFCVVGAFIFTWLIHKIHHKQDLNKKQTWRTVFWVLATHIILDACTTWGTSLLWPLSYRYSFSSIAIVDPLYTIWLLLAPLIFLFINRESPLRRKLNLLALVLSTTYLLSSLFSKQIMTSIVTEDLKSQSIESNHISVRPTIFNTILWQIAVKQEDYYLLGYRSYFDDDQHIQYDKIDINSHLLMPYKDHKDLKTLLFISEGQYAVEKGEGQSLLLHDLRFGRMGFGDYARFVFSYQLDVNEKGELVSIKPYRKAFKDTKSRLDNLWKRVFNQTLDP